MYLQLDKKNSVRQMEHDAAVEGVVGDEELLACLLLLSPTIVSPARLLLEALPRLATLNRDIEGSLRMT
jgi:hypothetical protein